MSRFAKAVISVAMLTNWPQLAEASPEPRRGPTRL